METSGDETLWERFRRRVWNSRAGLMVGGEALIAAFQAILLSLICLSEWRWTLQLAPSLTPLILLSIAGSSISLSCGVILTIIAFLSPSRKRGWVAAAASTASLAGLASLSSLPALPTIYPLTWPLSAGLTLFIDGSLVVGAILCLRISKLLIEGKRLTLP